MEFLKSAVASAIKQGPLAAYTIGDRVDIENSIWTLQNATKREGNSRCSIFTYDAIANRSRLPIAKNATRKSRILHHPGVVKILDTIETDTHIYIVTERITPLAWHTKRKSLSEESLKWGLCSIAKTIKFLNEEASSVHGCIRTSSVFTSDGGEWKLWGFELLSSVKDDESVIYTHGSLVPDSGRYLPPEIAKAGWDAIKSNPLPAVDAYGYAILICESFTGSFPGTDQAAQARGIPPSMQQSYKRLLSPNPKVRLTTSNFLDQGRRNGGFFQTVLINLTEGIDGLGLMSDGERDEFLGQLQEVSDDFPEDYLKRKILPELLKSVEFGGGGAKVFNVVLQIGTKLTDDEYENQLTPVLVRLFASPDRAIRVCLLDNLPLMIDHLSQKIVNDKVFPNLISGFTDVAPLVREQTVKSILTIITKLSERTINGELLKYLAKAANDSEPGIRTNTTICLGKIAKHIGPSTRSKVLVAAFSRSLRDPFVHARNAALLALAATADMFSPEDCANKMLPAIAPALLDKEKPVREQANKTFDQYLHRIRRHGQTLPDTAEPPPGTSNGTATTEGGAPRIGTPSQGDSGWAGWAISSFTNKLTTADGQLQPKQSTLVPRPTSALGNTSHSLSAPATRPASASPHVSTSRPDAQSLVVAASIPSTTTAPQITSDYDWTNSATKDDWPDADDDAAEEAADAWGAMTDDFDDSVTAPSIAPLQPTTVVAAVASGEPDFAAWLAAKNGPKPGRALPKGLGAAKGVTARPHVPRAATTGNPAVGAKKTVPVVIQPVAQEEEEGWGDAWE